MTHLPFRAPLSEYQREAEALLAAHAAGDAEAIRLLHENHPRFLDEKIVWLPRTLADGEIEGATLDIGDARLALARWYCFRDWAALSEFAAAVAENGSAAVQRFEAAVEAVVAGDLPALQALLRDDPALVHMRSTRVTHFDPPVHRSTLLHYVAANGVEGYRQKTPANAVEIATALLDAGAEVDSLAGLYGGDCTTMSLLVSSCHPAKAGLQAPLAELLIDRGASVDGAGSTRWSSNLLTALTFGYLDTARALARRGARVDDLAAAAGLGRLDDAARVLTDAGPASRHRALALAAQLGHADVVRLLVDAGEDPNRYNPEGGHAHSTPLHQAALAGHHSVVTWLVEHGGARLDIKDAIYHATPLGWAEHGGQTVIADYLRARLT